MTASFAHRMATITETVLARPLLELLPRATVDRLSDKTLGTGLLTPNAQFDSTVVTTEAAMLGDDIVASGRIRVDNVEAHASILPIQIDDTVHLIAIHHHSDGVRVVQTSNGGGARPGWLTLTDYRVDPRAMSSAVSWPDEPILKQRLDEYAVAMAQHIGESCSVGLQEARRRLATLQAPNGVASQSQLTAHQISKLEIEVDLVKDSARHDIASPWPLLCAAEHARRNFIQLLEELDVELGLEWQWDAAPWPSQADFGQLGGLKSIQGEDARRRGLVF